MAATEHVAITVLLVIIPFYGSDSTMACITGLGQQSDGIVLEFTRCWKYLGDLGIMAKDILTLLADAGSGTSNNETVRIAQLERILILVGKVSRIEMNDKKMEPKKCNFYNRGFCKNGSDCDFLHNHEVCERYEELGICTIKRCKKRHLYTCKFLTSEQGCKRGKSCNFSHRQEPPVVVERIKDDEVAFNETRKEEREKDRLGEGKFGWEPTREESELIETSGLPDLTKDEHEKENVKDRIEQGKDSIEDGEENEENDFYDQLINAINNGNGDLQNEVMDKILEGFDNAKNNNEDGKTKCVKVKKVGVRVKARGSGKGRGRGR